MLKTETGFAIDLEEKAISETDDCYHFEGYAAVFDNVDRGKDMIRPGAFKKSLAENGMPQLLYQHEMKEVVGVITHAAEDSRGLKVKGEMPKADRFVSDRLYPRLKHRSIKSMSIGYRVPPGGSERRKSDGVRLLKEIDLFECSFVTIPMNPRATVTNVKGFVEFQALPFAKSLSWDAEAAFKRITDTFGADHDEVRRAFLFADPDSGNFDTKFLIADLDENGNLVANRLAIYKAVASLVKDAKQVPEEAIEAVKEHLDRYYERLDLESPWKSFGRDEWKSLSAGERQIRLKGLGVSSALAKELAQLSGQPEADRNLGEPEAHSKEQKQLLITALDSFGELVSAIKAYRST